MDIIILEAILAYSLWSLAILTLAVDGHVVLPLVMVFIGWRLYRRVHGQQTGDPGEQPRQ